MAVSQPEVADAIVNVERRRAPEEQPLDEAGRVLVRRAYALFDFFANELRETHEQMRKARLIRQMKNPNRSRTAPPGTTLMSCIDNVIADQIDNMPEAQMLPEREETAQSAEEMADVVSFVLYQAGWACTYQKLMEDAVVTGTGVAEIFWDSDADRGEGMASVLAWHPEDFYPDPAAENIQDGRACFKATPTSVAWIEEHYPHAAGYVNADPYAESDEEAMRRMPDGDGKTTLIEFWYRRYDAARRRYRVHMALLAGGALLYSTELGFGGADREEYREGVYAHGRYPFVLYKYRDVYKQPFGTGLVHDYRDTQSAIDRCLKYIDDNARQSSIQRHFIRKGSGMSAEDVADLRKTIIEWEGSDIREVLQTVQAQPLNGQVYQIMTYLADSMKQDCGQNQFSRGEGGLGVTAASAIQALQEAGGKITRWHTEGFKNAFREMIEQLLWVLSEYLTPGRKIRIIGGWDSTGNMKERVVEIHAPRAEGDRLPKPAYTVRVQVQKNNPMQIQADNEFLLQAAQICAQGGAPLPPEAIIRLMEGYRTKRSVLRVIEENSRIAAEISELRSRNEQLGRQLSRQGEAANGYLSATMTQDGAMTGKDLEHGDQA